MLLLLKSSWSVTLPITLNSESLHWISLLHCRQVAWCKFLLKTPVNYVTKLAYITMHSYYWYILHYALHPLNCISVRLYALWGRDCLTVCTYSTMGPLRATAIQTTKLLFQTVSKYLRNKMLLIQQLLIKPLLMEYVVSVLLFRSWCNIRIWDS